MIAIIDYGMGNLGSIQNMFKRVGAAAQIMSDPDQIMKAEKLLLPGVGAFDAAMRRITETGLVEVLNYKALNEKVPVLGICLGMQLLTDCSDEGQLSGLGWISGNTHSFSGKVESTLRIPHMGWNVAEISNKNVLLRDFEGEVRFYFVHSYYVTVSNPSHSIMKTRYGIEFDSAIARNNIFGAQFHPEKSHRFGMKLFQNFAQI